MVLPPFQSHYLPSDPAGWPHAMGHPARLLWGSTGPQSIAFRSWTPVCRKFVVDSRQRLDYSHAHSAWVIWV
jgi:hypothetical protein